MKNLVIFLLTFVPLFSMGQNLIRWEQIKPIDAQMEKVSPTSNDLILIQDVADGDKIKYIKIASLGTGGSQQIDTIDIVNDSLRISLSSDGQALKKVNLLPYLDNTDEQTLTKDSTATSIGIKASGSNSRISFIVDRSPTNEIEVEDETYNSTNFNGATTKALSQDDFYDYQHISDTDDDGLPDKVDLSSSGFVKTNPSGVISVDANTYIQTELDPVFATDSSKILHWSDTIPNTKSLTTAYKLFTGLATKEPALTKGNLTENITGLQFDNTRQVVGGTAQLSLTSGYAIPTAAQLTRANNHVTNDLDTIPDNEIQNLQQVTDEGEITTNPIKIFKTVSSLPDTTLGFSSTIVQTIGNAAHYTYGIRNNLKYTGTNKAFVLNGIRTGVSNASSDTVSNIASSRSDVSTTTNSKTTNLWGNVSTIYNYGYFNKLMGTASWINNYSTDVNNNDAYGHAATLVNSGVFDGFSGYQTDITNTGTINDINGFLVGVYSTGTATNVFGINLGYNISHKWTGTPVNSYGIAIDRSIDRGSSLRYSILSESRSLNRLYGNFQLDTLRGIGNRMVIVGSNGLFSTQTIPTTGGTNKFLLGNVNTPTRNINIVAPGYTPSNNDLISVIPDDYLIEGDTITLSINNGTPYNIFGYTYHDISHSMELVYLDNLWYLLGEKGSEYLVSGKNTGDQDLCNPITQVLSSYTDTLKVENGIHGFLDISGNTTIRIEPTTNCNTGNIKILCEAAADSITFTSSYNVIISPYLGKYNGKVWVTNEAGAKDCYSYWFDGTDILINGTRRYE